MTGPDAVLEVRLRHRVHPGLTIDLALGLSEECGILFGPSGSGKSTILRLIAGLDRPEDGRVRLGGSVLFDASTRANRPLRDRRIGMIFQDDLLFPHRSVGGNVRFGLRAWRRAEADARVAEVAALCGIEGFLDRVPATLSGGERQRVGLARALAPRPRLLLCDEPVSALDRHARHELIGRIKAVQKAEAIPILYVTHAVDEAIALGRRMFRLSGGRIVAEGPPADLLAHPSTGDPPFRNVFEAAVESHDSGGSETTIRLIDGPSLIVPVLDRPIGARVVVSIRSDQIVLARGPVGAISARNLVAGSADRVVIRGPVADVLVQTGGVSWVVGVVPAAVESLGLLGGGEVRMIVKARSCEVHREDPA